MISRFLALARHPHRTASPPTRPPHHILPGSELNRQGLTNQTTHTKANREERDGEKGECVVGCVMVYRAAGGEGSRAKVLGEGVLPCSEEIQAKELKKVSEEEEERDRERL